jgi:hypothetical protein
MVMLIHPTLTLRLARDRRNDLMLASTRGRLEALGGAPRTGVVLRYAREADRPRLSRLAQLDSASAPSGPALVAEVDGELRAALPLDGTPPIANPFHRCAELVELLRIRAGQLGSA